MNNHLHITDAGLDLEKHFGRGPHDISPHGFATRAYTDADGQQLIGWRHRIRSSGNYMATATIDDVVAERLLQQDNSEAEICIKQLVTVPLNQYEFNALCSLVQDIGMHAFEESDVLALLNADDRAGAAQAIRNRISPGDRVHSTRRLAEYMLFQWRPHA